MIDYDKFRMSLKRLEEQHENYKQLDDSLPDLLKEGIAESVIQRFETCFDCLWKVLKRYLHEELGIADVGNSPKSVFRSANENRLFVAPLEQWLHYLRVRNDTAHDYSNEKAQDCIEKIPDFIDDAIGIYQTMVNTTWE